MAKKKKIRINPLYFLLIAASLVIAVTLPHSNLFQKEIVCANSISCIKDLSGKFEENAQKAVFLGRVIKAPQFLAQVREKTVLGQSTGENKHIYVDLEKQMLYAYEGQKLALSFPVSTGKWSPTPTGDFKIWVKLRYTRMTGGEGADFYDLPNVPYVMYFYNDEAPQSRGFGLHGAYWHNNFGHPMSHGCVNIKPENAEKLYSWANPVSTDNTTYSSNDDPGTVITIYGIPPSE